MSSPLVQASDLPGPFTLDLPFAANQATPIWLGHPEIPQTIFATLNLPIIPPDANASLLVTVFFQEKEGGFLRISWQGVQGAQILSNNFYEGIAMSNQRSLLISPETLLGDGTLGFQCGDTALGIQRIEFEWLENKDGVVSPLIPDLLVTSATGVTQPAQNLDGQPKQAYEASWHGRLVTIPVTTLPQRIEQGVEFSVQLDAVPASGRLSLDENGLPWGKHLAVWINQQRAGTVTPAAPDLADDGYLTQTNPPTPYVGWRNGSFYVPASLLQAGVNTVQFSAEDDTPPAQGTTNSVSATNPDQPLAIKNVVLQLGYPPLPSPTPTPPSPAPSPTPYSIPQPPPTNSTVPVISPSTPTETTVP